MWRGKSKKNKEQKERNRKRKRNVGSHKIETGAEGALTEGCRKRKAEVCSVKKGWRREIAGRLMPERKMLITGKRCAL